MFFIRFSCRRKPHGIIQFFLSKLFEPFLRILKKRCKKPIFFMHDYNTLPQTYDLWLACYNNKTNLSIPHRISEPMRNNKQ